MVQDYIYTHSHIKELDTRWLERLIADCRTKPIIDCIEPQNSRHLVFRSNLNLFEKIRIAVVLERSEFLVSLSTRLNAVKEFGLKASELLLDKVRNSQRNLFQKNDSFYKAICPHIPSIFITEGLLSVTPKREFDSIDAIGVYKSQIYTLSEIAKSWADEYGDITFN